MIKAALAAITVVLMLTAPACRGGGASEASADRDEAAFITVDPASTSPTDRAIADAIARIRANIADDPARIALAQAYLQKAREVADPSLYGRAEALLDDVAKRESGIPDLWIARGTLALALHEFEDALSYGEKALDLAQGNSSAYGVTVDAHNELGNLDAALKATQEMLDIKPDLPALSRASYARELRGDLPGAISAMSQAVTAGGGGRGGIGGENVAYTQTQLGGLLLTTGDIAGAQRSYEAALESFPGFALADVGRARVLVARGLPGEAADILAGVVDRQPLAEYAIAHGEALEAAGRIEEARVAYGLVDVIAQLYEANGVDVDREMALFGADHNPGSDSVERARDALEARPALASHDVLAWNLFKVGELDEAARESDIALSAGSKDPQERYHAAAIAMAQGNREKATENLRVTLDTNPRFSALLVDDVAALAGQLGLVMPPPAP